VGLLISLQDYVIDKNMTLVLTIIFFIFGLIVGSFLNVVIFRYNTSKNLGGRSMCMVCQKKLHWYELFPIFSFLFLKGRCKGCKTKISIQYPLIESATALIFLGIFFKFQDLFYVNTFIFSVTFIYYAAMFSILLVISMYDIKHKIIPDALVLIFGVCTFIGLFFFSGYGFNPHMPSVWEFMSGLVISAPFALLWLVSSGKWMGLGDAKLAVGLGWLIGMSRIFSSVVFSFWSGAIVGLLLMFLSKRYSIKSEIPFAPFLVLGVFIAFIFEIHLFQVLF